MAGKNDSAARLTQPWRGPLLKSSGSGAVALGTLRGMNRLQTTFRDLHAAGRKTLVPYVTGGYPDSFTTIEILKRIPSGPCACVEVGIPFSDPIADGPIIQKSFARALERGFKLDELLAAIAAARDEIALPLVAMVSYSIVYRRGPQRFVAHARAAGFDGLIVPDLAIEEADELAAWGRRFECPIILMAASTTEEQRRQRIAALSEPFVYYQSAGVTGERNELAPDLVPHVRELRAATGKPICVGFGISTPAHVEFVCAVADGAIVGSAIVRRMNEAVDRGESRAQIVARVTDFVGELALALPT